MAVITIGELVVDWLSVNFGQSVFQARDFCRAPGGNASNVAVALARLGTEVKLMGKIGLDFHGEYIKRHLAAEQIDLSYVLTDNKCGTAQCYMTTTERGDHHFVNFPNPHAADMLHPDELPEQAFVAARYLHVTGISLLAQPRRSAIMAAVGLARRHDLIISFDAGFPTGAGEEVRKAASEMLWQADLIKMNELELRFWSGLGAEAGLEQMSAIVFDRYHPVALLVTQAAAGSYILSAGGAVKCKPYTVAAVSEVGAGDAFMAGVLHSLNNLALSGRAALKQLTVSDWCSIGLAGNVCGALATRSVDAQSAAPRRAEFEQALKQLVVSEQVF